ncbi:MAG: hypothetical protein ACE5H3_12300 [Planctomycetota bacterium]
MTSRTAMGLDPPGPGGKVPSETNPVLVLREGRPFLASSPRGCQASSPDHNGMALGRWPGGLATAKPLGILDGP